MSQDPTEKDLLVEFERKEIPPHYKAYYLPKRQNLFATIQTYPYLWKLFMFLDEIIQHEFETMQSLRDAKLMVPSILFMNAHQKMRVAFELGCSTCLPEAHSLMRDSIESAAHGNRLANEPKLLKEWIEKNDTPDTAKLFKKEFELEKANRLFKGIPELHKLWKQYSDFGSHTNINSIVSRFAISQTATDLNYQLNYLGGDPRVIVPALFEMILAFSLIEKLFFDLCKTRLQFDSELERKRKKFESEKEAARIHIIKAFNLQPPPKP